MRALRNVRSGLHTSRLLSNASESAAGQASSCSVSELNSARFHFEVVLVILVVVVVLFCGACAYFLYDRYHRANVIRRYRSDIKRLHSRTDRADKKVKEVSGFESENESVLAGSGGSRARKHSWLFVKKLLLPACSVAVVTLPLGSCCDSSVLTFVYLTAPSPIVRSISIHICIVYLCTSLSCSFYHLPATSV